jgi:4-hydroxy-tetrahydrodipicolinate synthase
VGLAVRNYERLKRGLLACAAQRKPAAPQTRATQGEVDQLLRRLARHDRRAAL